MENKLDFSKMSDAAIASSVRSMAALLEVREVDNWKGVVSMAATMVLLGMCADAHVGTLDQELSDCMVGTNPTEITKWRLTIKKIEN